MKPAKPSPTSGSNGLSKFSDTPGDASLDDLFQPLDKNHEVRVDEASTSESSLQANHATAIEPVKNLAKQLRDTIAKKQQEDELVQANGGGNLLRLVMHLKDDVIDIDGLVCQRP